MHNFIIGELIETKINGAWYEAEILDIHGNYAYVYLFGTQGKVNVNLGLCRPSR